MSGPLRRWLHPLYKTLETSGHELRYLFIEITQRCNLSCLHCGSDCGRDARLEELTTEEWLAFFDYLPRRFNRDRLALVVTGGEPFCCPRFDELMAGLARNRLHWGMVTNGWALTPGNVGKIVAHGASSVTVSLDGLAGSHDWLRGRQGSFERAVEGIRLLTGSALPFFDVVTCVNPRNLAELPKVHDLLSELGVPAWRLFAIFPKGRAKQNAALRLSDEQLRQMFGFLREARKASDGRGPNVQFSCEGYLPPAIDAEVRDQPYFCRAGINIGSVLCDGAIAACPNITRTLVQGNIRTEDFATVWEYRYKRFRDRGWMRRGPCVNCAEWRQCQGNSLHLWDDEAQQTVLCHSRVLRPRTSGF